MATVDDRRMAREAMQIRARAALVAHLRTYREVRLGTRCERLDWHQPSLAVFEARHAELLAGVARLADDDRLVYTGPPAPPRAVLVGEDNPHEDPARPHPFLDLADWPSRAAGHRLRTGVLGCPREVYYGPDVHRHNLCRGPWRAPAAREEASRLAGLHPPEAVFVLLGQRVREAFGILRVPGDRPSGVVWGPAEGGGRRPVVLLPHPSGRCRVWNEPGAVAEARAALREAGLGWLMGERGEGPT